MPAAAFTVNPDVSLWRDVAVGLADEACNGSEGRNKLESRYQEVVEGRDKGARMEFYSSCADQAHWLLYRLGVRDKCINRDENKPVTLVTWRDQVNVSRLAWTCPITKDFGKSAKSLPPEPGDIGMIWTDNPAPKKKLGDDAHVFIVMPGAGDGYLRIANYGASGMSMNLFPGANITTPKFKLTPQGWMFGDPKPQQRRLQRIIRISDVMKIIKAPPNLEGCRVGGLDEYRIALGAVI